MLQPANLLPELERIVHEAGAMAQRERAQLTRELKPDGTIVTPADRKVEEYLRRELPRLLPNAGVYGEEFGFGPEGADGLWCMDPIDGTSNYSFGSPLWGVSVGLVQGETCLAGALYLPDLGETYLASYGGGATLNGQRIPSIEPGTVRPEQLLSYPDRILRMYDAAKMPGKMRHTGAFIVDAAWTCVQRFRGLVGLREKLYDVAASLCIAREVGADVRYADGEPLLIEPLKGDGKKLERGWLIFPQNSGFSL